MNVKVLTTGGTNKQNTITTTLRTAVLNGEFPAGTRLPIRTELETRFDASRMTVQKALDQLARDGYTLSRGKLGTFITDTPPCFCRYGIVFAAQPRDSTWGGYNEAMRMVGHQYANTPGREIVFYFGVNHPGDGDYDTLLADIQSQRLAGILFANGPWNIQQSPVVQQNHVPCMALMSRMTEGFLKHVPSITYSGLFDVAMETLKKKGCQRPAILIAGGYDQQMQHVRSALAKYEFVYDPARLQGVSLASPKLAEHVITLWMRLPKNERPDGLFVADDNLVDCACSGLLRAGLHPGVDLPVAVHSNFPSRVGGSMPLDRVGYDIRTLVQKFIETTDARRHGTPFAMSTTLSAVHESEIEAVIPKSSTDL